MWFTHSWRTLTKSRLVLFSAGFAPLSSSHILRSGWRWRCDIARFPCLSIPKSNDKQWSDYGERHLQDWDGFQGHFYWCFFVLLWSLCTYAGVASAAFQSVLPLMHFKGHISYCVGPSEDFLLHFTPLLFKSPNIAVPWEVILCDIPSSSFPVQFTEQNSLYTSFSWLRRDCGFSCSAPCIWCLWHLRNLSWSANVWLISQPCNKLPLTC